MKRLLGLLLVVFAFVACNSCAPQPAPAPIPVPPVVVVDAGPVPTPTPIADAAPAPVEAGPAPVVNPGVRLACDNLAKLKCAEGMPGCYGVLQRIEDEHLTSVPLSCIVSATDKPSARACGKFVVCP